MFGRLRNPISIRWFFIFITLLTFILPIIGITFLRIHESILIRQTENSIFAQGASISAMYKQLFSQSELANNPHKLNQYLQSKLKIPENKNTEKWSPWLASLDLLKDEIKITRTSIPSKTELIDTVAQSIGNQITPIIKELQLSTLAGIRILDTRANIVATNGKITDRQFIEREEIDSALNGTAKSVLRNKVAFQPAFHLASISRKNPLRVYYAQPVIFQKHVIAVVYAFRTPAPASKNLYQQRYLIIPLVLVLLVVGIVISLLASIIITKPIKLLVYQAQHIIRGDIKVLRPLEKPVTKEVKRLSETLSEMAKIQNQRANYIKNFASHVSHEFKTPLSSIKGSIEMLTDKEIPRSELEDKELYQLIKNGTDRIQQLIEHLTKLARADSTKLKSQSTPLNNVIQNSQSKYLFALDKIDVKTTSDEVAILMDKELVESVFLNLFDNVCKHGGQEVSIRIENLNEKVSVTFSDNGGLISSANSKRIFDPFYTTKKQLGGTGLGLAIIKSIMVAHQGDVKLIETSPNTTFELTFIKPI